MNTSRTRRPMAAAALLGAAALALSACSGGSDATTSPDSAATPTSTTVASTGTRVALTYDGGLLVLDAETLEVTGDLPLEGFNRVNPAGDDTHALVSTTAGFQVLDVQTPELTDVVFDAPTPGHVVRHGDKTVLFSDGTGETTIFDTAELSSTELPETETVPAIAAHHGVSIVLEDGTVLTTVGTSEARTGIRVLAADGTETMRNEQCPSVHGEGAAADEAAVFGCSDGVLVYQDGAITKIQAEDAYGRTGNIYSTDTSPIAVGDYNSDPDSEGYLLSEITLIDTVAKTARVVDLPTGVEYTWRGVARGADDEAIILASDGSLHVLDPQTGELIDSHPVIGAWESPVEWQDAHPALVVSDGIAYVTEPATDSIHSVDLETGEIIATGTLPATPNEIAVVG